MNFLRRWPKPTLIERIFVAALAVLCMILTLLQYRWTGEISRGTIESLRAGFGDQAGLLCQSFDAELTNACNLLLPYDDELAPGNRAVVDTEHLRRWMAGKHRPIFRRMAVAAVENGVLQFYLLDQHSPRLTPGAWPPEWAIMELDFDYIGKTWLPELVATYLNREGRVFSDVVVETATRPARVIFATQPGATAASARGERTVSLPFNRRGRTEGDERPRGGGNSWQLTAAHRPIALAALLGDALAATPADTAAAGCRVQAEIPPGLPTVAGDAPALRRVFQNLLTNAAKHAGQGRWIGVFAARAADGGGADRRPRTGHSASGAGPDFRGVLPGRGGAVGANPWQRPGTQRGA